MSNMSTDKPGTQLKSGADDQNGNPEVAVKGKHTYVDGLNSPLAPGAPDDPQDAIVFAQGRTAALGGIGMDDAPYSKEDANLKIWQKGYKSV